MRSYGFRTTAKVNVRSHCASPPTCQRMLCAVSCDNDVRPCQECLRCCINLDAALEEFCQSSVMVVPPVLGTWTNAKRWQSSSIYCGQANWHHLANNQCMAIERGGIARGRHKDILFLGMQWETALSTVPYSKNNSPPNVPRPQRTRPRGVE